MPRNHIGGSNRRRAVKHREAVHLDNMIEIGYKELRARLKGLRVKIPFGASTVDLARLYLKNGGAV